MQQIIKISLFLVGLASTSAIAAEHQHLSHEAMQAMPVNAGQQWSDGVVKKVDRKAGQITLKHSAIAGSMPAMTMSYHVVPAESLKSMQAGDKVRFVLKKDNEAYVVTRIEAVR